MPVVVVSGAGGVMAVVPSPWDGSDVLPLRFGIDALPAALWGCGFALAQRRLGDYGRAVATAPWTTLGLAVTVICLAGLALQAPHRLLANTAGVGWAIAGLSGFAAAPRLARWAASLPRSMVDAMPAVAFGVYVIHIIPTGVLRSVGARHGLDTDPLFAAAASLVIIAVSAGASLVLLRFRVTAWLLCERGSKPAAPPAAPRPLTVCEPLRQAA